MPTKNSPKRKPPERKARSPEQRFVARDKRQTLRLSIMINKLKNLFSSKASAAFCIGLLLILLINLITLSKECFFILTHQPLYKQQFADFKYADIAQKIQGSKYVGYFTDKDTKTTSVEKDFAQASYLFAPSILGFNNTSHVYVVFDCSSASKAMEKIQELGLTPVYQNRFGVILAKKN